MDFQIGDLADNLVNVEVELNLDTGVPIGPPMELPYMPPPPNGLVEWLEYYYLTGQTELIPALAS